ncbi:MAG: serine/threonine-protein kinase, partial [bacterium]|nr:serine/threonine-protein kinase [bacterium]
MNRPDQFERMAALFEHARGLEPEARIAYLDLECVEEPELRAHVNALLDRHDRGGLLDDPIRPSDVSADPAPERIGHFRIIDCLGRGGMGVVYRAEQDQPRRQVALKIMHAGLISEQLRRRFEFETSVLARLQHASIAQIYEAGTSDAGSGPRPFFAMELVDGVTLDKFIAQAQPSIEARLRLFIAICDAVQHAHQKGVIHRDLKPANILVTEDSVPKILDFGVARATDTDVQATLFTTPGQIVGTLAYMSPEQVSMATDKLDTRSDVYSLGVILYELLAERLPYEVASGSIAGAIRVIEEAEPKSLTSTSRALRGDLDTIVLRSLRKRPEDRYQSASDLAADIRRFLNREPIAARPPSSGYQLRKFAQRNKALVGGVMATFVALVLGVIGTGYGMLEMTAQRDEARLQASIVAAVNTFLADDLLAQADPQIEPDRAIPLHVVLDRAAERIEGKFENARLVEASIRRTIGRTYDNLGRYDAARTHLTRALDLYSGELGDWHEDTNHCRSDLGMLLMNVGEYDRAERIFLDMLAVQKEDLGDLHRDTISSLQNLGAIYLVQGRYDQAEPILLKTLDTIRRVDQVDDGEVAITLNNLGSVYMYMGRLPEAEELFTEGLALQKRVHGLEHPHTLQAMAGLGTLYA